MKWDAFLDVLRCDYQDEHAVEVSGREVPFDETNPDGIYAKIADSDGSRPGFRDDLAHHSDLMSLGIPR